MVTPATKREAIAHLQTTLRMSERRACAVVGADRTSKVIDTGPMTNHVNFAYTPRGEFAYVTVGGLNQVKVFRQDDFTLVATISVGALPHGVWPSGDGSRVYVGLENADAMAAIDTATNRVIGVIPIGQAAQAVNYVPNAVATGDGRQGLQPLGLAGRAAHLDLGAAGTATTSVSLFDQGLVQIVQAAVAGLQPQKSYVLGLTQRPDGSGPIQSLATFITNPAGSAIVNATGPIRQLVKPLAPVDRRYLVIAEGTTDQPGPIIQRQIGAARE